MHKDAQDRTRWHKVAQAGTSSHKHAQDRTRSHKIAQAGTMRHKTAQGRTIILEVVADDGSKKAWSEPTRGRAGRDGLSCSKELDKHGAQGNAQGRGTRNGPRPAKSISFAHRGGVAAQDRTRQHRIAQGGTRSHKLAQAGTSWHKLAQARTRPHKIAQDRTRSHKLAQCGTRPHKAAQQFSNLWLVMNPRKPGPLGTV